MDVILIIPCLNEERHIRQLTEQLLQDPPSASFRIIIADGGSSDHTPHIAQELASLYPNVLYLHNPKKIQSAAVNLAVATYGADVTYLIRIDAHASYPSGFCQALIEEAEATGAASVVVTMQTEGKDGFQKAVAAAQNSALGNGGSAHRSAPGEGKFVDHGHHALMRVSAYRDAGGYDESFSHNEDAELDARLRKKNYTIWLTGKTSLTYYPRSKALPLFKQYIHYGNGRLKTVLKHQEPMKIRQIIPAGILPALLIAPLCFITAIPIISWALLCLVYGGILALKRRDPVIALSGIAAMIMHLGWSIGFWKGVMAARHFPSIRGA